MKFLRMPNKAQSQKHVFSKVSDQNKENINPCQSIKVNPKPKNPSQQLINMQVEELPTQVSIQVHKREQQHYQEQILKFLISTVRTPSQSYNYFSKQPDITQHMRMVLLNWLIDVHLKYKLQTETFFITVSIIDRFLSNQVVYRNELQLVGITALWIASKYEQTYQVPKISNLVYVCDSTYTDKQILNMQSRIIEEINFDFLNNTSFTYYQTLKRYTFLNDKDYFLGRYLLESVLFDLSTRKYSELVIAASVIFFIQKLRGYQFSKQKKIHQFCKINYKQIRACARQVCFIWQKINDINQISSLRQKFMRPEFLQVAKIRITQKSNK